MVLTLSSSSMNRESVSIASFTIRFVEEREERSCDWLWVWLSDGGVTISGCGEEKLCDCYIGVVVVM